MKRNPLRAFSILALAVLALSLPACKKNEPVAAAPAPEPAAAPVVAAPVAAVTIADVQLGKSVGADKKVAQPVEVFAPGDTIFASVATNGSAPTATVHAKWTFQDGQTVKDDSRAITPSGPAVTEFSIQKPGGWPKGTYKVDVSVDGGPVTTKNFRVE